MSADALAGWLAIEPACVSFHAEAGSVSDWKLRSVSTGNVSLFTGNFALNLPALALKMNSNRSGDRGGYEEGDPYQGQQGGPTQAHTRREEGGTRNHI